jgi:membrane protein
VSKHSTPDIKKWITRAIEYITADIWRVRLEDLPFGKSFLIKQLRIIILTLRGFVENKCFFRASSLTFYTLLSIVPVAAMLFGIAKGFGFERMLRKEIFERFPGEAQQEVLTKVIEFAESMLEATKGGLIAGIGLIVLFWSVIKVLSHDHCLQQCNGVYHQPDYPVDQSN